MFYRVHRAHSTFDWLNLENLIITQSVSSFNGETLVYLQIFVKRIIFVSQVMVFVHARNATVKTAMTMREMSKLEGDNELFEPDKNASYGAMEKKVITSF